MLIQCILVVRLTVLSNKNLPYERDHIACSVPPILDLTTTNLISGMYCITECQQKIISKNSCLKDGVFLTFCALLLKECGAGGQKQERRIWEGRRAAVESRKTKSNREEIEIILRHWLDKPCGAI